MLDPALVALLDATGELPIISEDYQAAIEERASVVQALLGDAVLVADTLQALLNQSQGDQVDEAADVADDSDMTGKVCCNCGAPAVTRLGEDYEVCAACVVALSDLIDQEVA